MTIYPNANYDTFCSVTDADTILSNYVPKFQRAEWDAITDPLEKEILLRQSTLLIKQKIQELPSTLEIELQQACAFLANDSIGKNMRDEDGNSNLKRKKIDGVIEKEYFNPSKESNSFSDLVEQLLSKYDVQTDGVFVFDRS